MSVDTENFYRILANQERRRILTALCREPEICVCELADGLQLPQPLISRHLGMMREAGLLSFRRSGTWMFYRLSPQLALWAWRSLELMSDGEAANPLFVADGQRLMNRPVRHAAADLERSGLARPVTQQLP